MRKKVKISISIIASIIIILLTFNLLGGKHLLQPNKIGDPIDSLNGVVVYYNGPISNVSGRNTAKDGYNIGQKYQCVEFVKRYYYEYLNHKMPDSYGHAKDFFNPTITDGKLNKQRNLVQYTNGSKSKPMVSDLMVMGGGSHGHVFIVSQVFDDEIEIIQQNPGPGVSSREKIGLKYETGKWYVKASRVLGWLRKE